MFEFEDQLVPAFDTLTKSYKAIHDGIYNLDQTTIVDDCLDIENDTEGADLDQLNELKAKAIAQNDLIAETLASSEVHFLAATQ
jgi:hypothetical protein